MAYFAFTGQSRNVCFDCASISWGCLSDPSPRTSPFVGKSYTLFLGAESLTDKNRMWTQGSGGTGVFDWTRWLGKREHWLPTVMNVGFSLLVLLLRDVTLHGERLLALSPSQ